MLSVSKLKWHSVWLKSHQSRHTVRNPWIQEMSKKNSTLSRANYCVSSFTRGGGLLFPVLWQTYSRIELDSRHHPSSLIFDAKLIQMASDTRGGKILTIADEVKLQSELWMAVSFFCVCVCVCVRFSATALRFLAVSNHPVLQNLYSPLWMFQLLCLSGSHLKGISCSQ